MLGGRASSTLPYISDQSTRLNLRLSMSGIEDDLDLLFNETAQERANESLWDPLTNTATTAESDYIGGIMEALATCDRLYTFPDDNDSANQGSTNSDDNDSDESAGDHKRNSGKLSIGEVSTVVTTKTFSKEPESVLRKPKQPKQVSPEVKVVSFPGQGYGSSFNSLKYGEVKYGDTTSITSGITHDEMNKKIEQKIETNNTIMYDFMQTQRTKTDAQQIQLDAIQQAVMKIAASSEKGGQQGK
jgi:hypothetical protein